jgi:hypothetical protein
MGSTAPTVQWIMDDRHSGERCYSDHWLPNSADIKNAWTSTSTSHSSQSVCLVNKGVKFSFTLTKIFRTRGRIIFKILADV